MADSNKKQKHAGTDCFRLHFIHSNPSDRFLGHSSIVEKEETFHGRRALSMQKRGPLNYKGPSDLQVEVID